MDFFVSIMENATVVWVLSFPLQVHCGLAHPNRYSPKNPIQDSSVLTIQLSRRGACLTLVAI